MFIIKSEQDYSKIRGTLALVLIFLYIHAFRLLNGLVNHNFPILNDEIISQLINPSGDYFDIIVFIKIYGELLLTAVLFVLNVKLIYAFHKKTKSVSKLFLLFVILNIATIIFSILFTTLNENLTFENYDYLVIQKIVYSLLILIIAFMYTYNSERAKLTFIK